MVLSMSRWLGAGLASDPQERRSDRRIRKVEEQAATVSGPGELDWGTLLAHICEHGKSRDDLVHID